MPNSRRLVRYGATAVTGFLLASLCPFAARADAQLVSAEHGMVVSAHRLASQVGVDVLKQGGNAIDAAAAVGYALAVVYPVAGNLGGGGFMSLRLADGRESFLDFRERAPQAASAAMYQDADGNVIQGRSTDGWLAVGVPGTVMGLEVAREKWGKLSRSAALAPAIRLASRGFEIGAGDGEFAYFAELLRKHLSLAKLYLKPDGSPLKPGDRLVQPELAVTLGHIAREGWRSFYRGETARAIVASSAAGGGILTMDDFARYKTRELAPIHCDYRGYRIESAPPPSSGGVTLCEMLHILEGFPLDRVAFHSAEEVHDLAEAMRIAFADRNEVLGDPDFVANPIARLLDRAYADGARAKIDPKRAGLSRAPADAPREGANTTHYSIVDAAGNAVAVTYTLNGPFGAGIAGKGTGVILNNEMDDFTSKAGVPNQFGLVQGEANAIAPGKTPLSSMTPTIVTKDGRLAMVVGSPGGPRIITTVLETIVDVVDHRMSIAEAVSAPRVHHQWLPDILFAERGGLTPDVQAELAGDGYTIKETGPWSQAEGILAGGAARYSGAADPRGAAGAAIGY